MNKLATKIIAGFNGQSPEDPGVKYISQYVKDGLAGVILFRKNISSPEQLKLLTSYFHELNPDLIISIDQEGGAVRRMRPQDGFHDMEKSAKSIVDSNIKDEDVYEIYNSMAKTLYENGVNMNFGPVVDLHSENSQIIGKYERAFSDNPEVVVKYAEIFIRAHNDNGISTCIKHFPGHGLVTEDSHKSLPDATNTFDPKELQTFLKICDDGMAEYIMTAHIMNDSLDPNNPATCSHETLSIIKNLYPNVKIISDDLCMQGFLEHCNGDIKSGLIDALKAGCDLAIISFNDAAHVGEYEIPYNMLDLICEV